MTTLPSCWTLVYAPGCALVPLLHRTCPPLSRSTRLPSTCCSSVYRLFGDRRDWLALSRWPSDTLDTPSVAVPHTRCAFARPPGGTTRRCKQSPVDPTVSADTPTK